MLYALTQRIRNINLKMIVFVLTFSFQRVLLFLKCLNLGFQAIFKKIIWLFICAYGEML